ncbi:S8 family serine peptidase [Mesobacillus foraminis]|uniref:S8 family serine peptidase n=1 Tax=Mesobacillus foraminis TaxID=279826 RepID=UPI001BEB1B9A|nr:S8 family serine peptidase [Mesobacillus foraminis]MBT2756694.1 S8 family serine peptidase [Mesobacillus foraminis]
MRVSAGFLVALLCLLLSVSAVSAEGLKVEPDISKFDTNALFDDSKEYNSSQLIVKFKADADSAKRQRILESIKLKELSSIDKGDTSLISVPKGTDLEGVAKALLKNKEIVYVEPNYRVETQYTPSDPGYSKQWYLKKIQAPKAWDQSKGSSSITVAVIDAGVQTSHPDLKGRIVSPYNAVTGGSTFTPDDHGTHVAGTIAASINKSGVAGVAPNVKIMPINVFSGEYGSTYAVIDGIYYAADHNANVINMSLGGYSYSYSLEYAIAYARSKGVLVVAAAGNDDTSQYTYPAALPNVIGVSATDSRDRITDFSNYGNYIDFAAPGEDIYSTVTGSKYQYMDGTSMASPVVSGVAALILSKNPLLSPSEVESIMKSSAADLGNSGWDYYYGYGRVDANKALQKTSSPMSNISAAKSFAMNGSNKTTMSFTAKKNTTVSLYIQTSNGKTVRNLVKNKVNTGKVSSSWDGKQDNGVYVSSGTYKIVAKATNGKETVTKTASIKVSDKVKPTIKLGSSMLFSPTAKGKLTIPYELNKTAKVTAIIYDSKNKAVKTLLNNASVSGGKKSLTWDGKNSSGKMVSDGTYKLVMTSIDSSKNKGTPKQMSIKVDNSKPTATLSLTSSVLKMDGKSVQNAKLTFKEQVTATTYVTAANGTKVKKLSSNKTYKAGTISLSWDGKNDKGSYLAEGNYLYLVEFKDAAGNSATVKSKPFSLQDWRKPVVSSTATLYYRSAGNATYDYSISKAGKVTVQIYQGTNLVRTVQENAAKPAGKNSFTWDGKSKDGSSLADGQYQYKITVTDKYNQSHTYTGKLVVAVTKVVITYPGVVEFYEGEELASEVYYELSQDASVTIEIYDVYNDKIRTIASSQQAKKGINYFSWDGTDQEGWPVYDDLYYYVIKAKNAAGNESKITGKMTNEEYPSWLTAIRYSFTEDEEDYWYNRALNLSIDVTQEAKLQLYVFDSSYFDELLDLKEYSLKKGTNSFVYDKPSTDYLYYGLKFTDRLGNSYHYGLDEYYSSYSKQNSESKPKAKIEKPEKRPDLN